MSFSSIQCRTIAIYSITILVLLSFQAYSLNPDQRLFYNQFKLPEKESNVLTQFFSSSFFYAYLNKKHFSRKKFIQQLKKDSVYCYKVAISKIKHRKYLDIKLIFSLPSLPDYIVKIKVSYPRHSKKISRPTKNISRVIGAYKIQESIKKHSISSVIVPDKYLYHLPQCPDTLEDNNYAVVVKKQNAITFLDNPQRFHSIPQKQYRDLFKVIKDVGYHDASYNNIYVTPDNKFVFVDTEIDSSLWNADTPFKWNHGFSKKLCGIRGKAKFCKWNVKAKRSFLSSLFIGLQIV